MSLVRIAVNLPEETVKRIEDEMHNHGWLSRSEVVRTALADWFRDRSPASDVRERIDTEHSIGRRE